MKATEPGLDLLLSLDVDPVLVLALNAIRLALLLRNISLVRLLDPLLASLGSHGARRLRIGKGVSGSVVGVVGLPLASALLTLRLGCLRRCAGGSAVVAGSSCQLPADLAPDDAG